VAATADEDVDLYLRHAVPLADYVDDPDHRATEGEGNETLRVTPATTPPLRPGVYFLDVAHTLTTDVERVTVSVRFGK